MTHPNQSAETQEEPSGAYFFALNQVETSNEADIKMLVSLTEYPVNLLVRDLLTPESNAAELLAPMDYEDPNQVRRIYDAAKSTLYLWRGEASTYRRSEAPDDTDAEFGYVLHAIAEIEMAQTAYARKIGARALHLVH